MKTRIETSITDVFRHASWAVGVGMAVCSCFFVALGMSLQKKSHLLWKSGQKIGAAAAWFTGLACLVLVPFPLNLLIFEFSAQSLMASLEPITLVFLLYLAWLMHGEEVTTKDATATLLMAFGAFVCAFTGAHHEKTFTWDELKNLFLQPHFITFISVSLCILTLLLIYILFFILFRPHLFDPKRGSLVCDVKQISQDPQSKRILLGRSSGRPPIFPLLIAITAAGFGAFMNLSMKFASESMKTDQVTSTVVLCALSTALAFAILQLSFVNLGIKYYKQVLFTPLYQCCLIVFGVLVGFVTWKEYESLDWWECMLFILGVLIVITGLLLLMLRKTRLQIAIPSKRSIQTADETPRVTPREFLI